MDANVIFVNEITAEAPSGRDISNNSLRLGASAVKMFNIDKMHKGATPLKLNQGLNASIQIFKKMRSIFYFLFCFSSLTFAP